MRTVLAAHRELTARIDELETRFDSQFAVVFEALRQLMMPPKPPRKHPLGFTTPKRDEEG
jgi:hypothetical protein